MKTQTIAAAVGAALIFGAGWAANGWRADARIALLKQEHSEQVARNSGAALETYTRMEKTKDDALKEAQTRAQANAADAGRATAAVDGLRKQLAGVPVRIAAASRAAVDEYAATAGELLGACTAEYQWLARQADQHLVNERLLIAAWPE